MNSSRTATYAGACAATVRLLPAGGVPRDCECGDHLFMAFAGGLLTLCSPEDRALLAEHRWAPQKRGGRNRSGTPRKQTAYVGRDIRPDGKHRKVWFHRVVSGVAGGLFADHINGNTLDNRRANLRPSTRSQNALNRGRNPGRGRFKGVSFNKRTRKWRAVFANRDIGINVSSLHASEREAAAAYDAFARQYGGGFAKTNADLGLL